MSWLSPLVALAVGTGLWAVLNRRENHLPPLVAIPALGILALEAWLRLLALAGIAWTPLLLAAPAWLALLALRRPPAWSSPAPAAAVASALALVPAVLVGARPAFGWDFRYIWGLKARVIAGAQAVPFDWLRWEPHAFAHPDYPLLWPDLIAHGLSLGGRVDAVAAAWHAVLVLALAAACWRLAAGASPWMRALAAAAGAWTPVLLLARHSGYAEPLLALGTALALGALSPAHSNRQVVSPGVLGVAIASLTKSEGAALAVAVVVAAAVGARRRAMWLAAALLPALLWRLSVLAAGVPAEAFRSSPAFIARRLAALPHALGAAIDAELALLLLAWLLALLAGVGRGPALALVCWSGAVILAYTAGSHDPAWRAATSLERVLAAPLPAVIALALARCPPHRAAAPPAPAPPRDEAPCA